MGITMPAKKQFKFGITCEFEPLWNEFEKLSPTVFVEKQDGSSEYKPNQVSKMIRYLIYNFLYNNGSRTRNTFEDTNSEDWEYVEGALKVHNKFNKKRIEVMKEHVINKKKFWVEKYDYAIQKEIVSKEELQKLKDDGFVIMKNIVPYYLLPDIDQANNRIILKRMNGNNHEQITRYLSKPNEYFVKCKWRNNSYPYYEEAYDEFRALRKRLKDPFPTTLELFHINQKLIDRLRSNNLLNPRIGQQFGLHSRESVLKNDLTPWKETPKELDDCLPLNKFHIDTKKNLQKLRSNEEVIYNNYTILKFKIDEAPKIIGPRKETAEEANEWRLYDE
tara:strand:+ start:275 stop:1273 length:999 start_codon:yes stop_codon:yes gene_type:complete